MEARIIRFSVCIETIFDKLPLADRIAQSAACGASAVEFWTWRDKDLDAITRAKEAVGVDVAAFVALTGTTPGDPGSADAAVAELLQDIDAARQIGASGLIIRPGPQLERPSRDGQLESIAGVLAAVAPSAEKAHITILLEPLNPPANRPGTLLATAADAAAVLDRIALPNVKMLFDVYEQYLAGGSVLDSIESNIARIGHFHLADVPGRGEPGTGSLDFPQILKLIGSLGYQGCIGLEFYPSGDHTKAVRAAIDLA